MQTLEKEVENTTVRRRRSDKNSENKSERKKGKGKIVLKTMLGIIITGMLIGLFLLYGPITKFREWYITSAMTTMTHQYLATWFYSDATINDVLSKNTVVEVDGITDTNQINTDDKSKEEADLSKALVYSEATSNK
jgi:exopolysaccharide biosynthesis protein